MIRRIFQISGKFSLLILVYFMMFLVLFFSKELSLGIKTGIDVSINLVIPSLFIFMILSNIIINSKLKHYITRPFKFVSKYVFRISQSSMAIVLLSLVGGYPVGAKLINNAIDNNTLTTKEASNLLCYSVNCGPAFLISGVGIALFSSVQVGLLMYLSQVISCSIVGFILSFFGRNCPTLSIKQEKQSNCSYPILFVKSVNDAVKSMAIICGFIVAFSAFMPIVTAVLTQLGSEYGYLVHGFLEVTTGCNNLMNISSSNTILLATAFTAFGGVCVHLQVYAMISPNGVKMGKFMLFRILYTIISVSLMKIFLSISPVTVNCISFNPSIKQDTYSVSPTSTVFMISLAFMLLFFSKKSDTINTRTKKG